MRCVPQVLDIKAKAKIMFRLTLSTNYEKRSVDIHIGDFIDGLIYQSSDSLREVSGIVRSINTFERALPSSSYNSPDFISLRNVIKSITLDISDKYNSELITIDIESIRNYDMVIHNTLDIKNLEITDNNLVRFYCETKPIAFVWNGKSFPINPVEIMDFTYMVNIDTMNMTNTLTIFDDSGSIYKRVINGPGMDVVDEDDVMDNMINIMSIFKNQFFEKYNAIDLTEMIGDSIYTPLVKNIGNIESFTMNDVTYYTDELPYVDLIIPNRDAEVKKECSAVVYPFKIIDGDFCVCVPIISHFTDNNGILSLKVNGYEQSWSINKYKNCAIDINRTIAMNVPNGYVPSINSGVEYDGTPTITFNRSHLSTYPNIYYSSKNFNELNRGIMSMSITEDNGWTYNYRMVDLSTVKNRESKESIYIPNQYLDNAPVSVNDKRKFEYGVYVFGEGYIRFTITLVDTRK